MLFDDLLWLNLGLYWAGYESTVAQVDLFLQSKFSQFYISAAFVAFIPFLSTRQDLILNFQSYFQMWPSDGVYCLFIVALALRRIC